VSENIGPNIGCSGFISYYDRTVQPFALAPGGPYYFDGEIAHWEQPVSFWAPHIYGCGIEPIHVPQGKFTELHVTGNFISETVGSVEPLAPLFTDNFVGYGLMTLTFESGTSPSNPQTPKRVQGYAWCYKWTFDRVKKDMARGRISFALRWDGTPNLIAW
jgi:hypothetical protein